MLLGWMLQERFMNSPFLLFSTKNDVVYVEPDKNKINGAAVNP
jgi:hypothetical protein